jgi:RNA polymerase sigma factor (sigma-70 family)
VLRRCAEASDGQAWREFDRRFRNRIASAVRQALRELGHRGGQEQVEDFVQDVYCRLLEGNRRRLAACRGQSDGEVEYYLARVAERVVRDEVRRGRAAKRGGGAGAASAWVDDLPDGADGPEDRLLLAEARRRFLGLCRELLGERAQARHLAILRLALLEGWSSREIAGRLRGIEASSVDSVVHRFKVRLAGRGVSLPRRAAERGA